MDNLYYLSNKKSMIELMWKYLSGNPTFIPSPTFIPDSRICHYSGAGRYEKNIPLHYLSNVMFLLQKHDMWMLSAHKYVHNYAFLNSITGLVHTQPSFQALHLIFLITIRNKYTSNFFETLSYVVWITFLSFKRLTYFFSTFSFALLT